MQRTKFYFKLVVIIFFSQEVDVNNGVITLVVKSGKFGQSAKFGLRHCFFIFLIIGIIIKLTKQTVNLLMRCLIWMFTVCKCMSEFTRCPKLPDFILVGISCYSCSGRRFFITMKKMLFLFFP